MTIYDYILVGAGIAGASLAAELGAQGASVLVLEAEERPGYHSTGRSAAFWEECYGGPGLVPLTLPSGDYLREHDFLNQRGALYIGRDEDAAALDSFMERFAGTGVTIERLDRPDLQARLPGLRETWAGAIWEPACADIDVAALHAHYLKRAANAGVILECRAKVEGLDRQSGVWSVRCADGRTFKTSTLVNCAGAWADSLAQTAGAMPLGIQPLRRTVVQLRTEPAPDQDLPLVLDIAGQFYFKPESGRVWLSPHDEEPSPPCDAAPEELAVAQAIDRFQNVVDWEVRAVERRWAGLRSFAPDRLPIYGYDPQVEGFAWFAGQGGFGIQTSPAAARLGSQVLLGTGRDILTRDIDPAVYSPARFH